MGDEARKITYLKRGGTLVREWDPNPYHSASYGNGNGVRRQATAFVSERPVSDQGDLYKTPYLQSIGSPEVAQAEVELEPPTWQNHYAARSFNKNNMQATDAGRKAERQQKPGDQGTLFHREPGTIYSAFSAKSMRHTVPTLLGLAANEHARQFADTNPPLPKPSADLSQHSSRMVQGLQRRGVDVPTNQQNPDSEPSNDIDWESTGWMEHTSSQIGDTGTTTLDAATVQAGRDTMKSALRKKPLAQQFSATEDAPKSRQIPGQLGLW